MSVEEQKEERFITLTEIEALERDPVWQIIIMNSEARLDEHRSNLENVDTEIAMYRLQGQVEELRNILAVTGVLKEAYEYNKTIKEKDDVTGE